MAEPGPDCSSLLDEDLSSFVFSYLADSQVGSAGRGALLSGSAARCSCRGGTDRPPPRCLPGHPGEERGCGARPARRVARGVRRCGSLRRCGAVSARGAVRAPVGAPSRAAAAPQPRRRFQHHSHVDSRGPPVPPSAGGLRGTGDKLMGRWVSVQNHPPPGYYGSPKGGEGAARLRVVVGGAPQGAARWGLLEPGCGMSHAQRQFHAHGLGSWGMEGWGWGCATATGVSELRVAGSKMWMGCVLDGAGYSNQIKAPWQLRRDHESEPCWL